MARLILHVGTHKTGTTALQLGLYAARETLARDSIVYAPPRDLMKPIQYAHHGMSLSMARFNEKDQSRLKIYKDRVHEDLDQGKTVIISAEPFFRRVALIEGMQEAAARAVYLDRLRDWLEGLPVTTTIYLRRPDSFAESLFKEHSVGGGSYADFDAYIEAKAHLFDYGSKLAEFQSLPGDVQINKFEDAAGQGLISHFLSAHDLPVKDVPEATTSRPSVGANAALWLCRWKHVNQDKIGKHEHRARWLFALKTKTSEMWAEPKGAVLWRDHARRVAFFETALSGFADKTKWDTPPAPKAYAHWDDSQHETAEKAFRRWSRRNLPELWYRKTYGIKPYHPLTLERILRPKKNK